tara:strand:- start:224 stop:568 length:345 start_codon:yes stop_codon:yes gene_type:complete
MSKNNKSSFIDRIFFSTDDYDEKHHQAKAVSESRHRKNGAMPNKTNKVKKTKSGLVSKMKNFSLKSFLTKKKSNKSSKGKVMKMKGGAKRKNKRSTKKRKNMRRKRRTRRRRKR